jgi:hypothetical protein
MAHPFKDNRIQRAEEALIALDINGLVANDPAVAEPIAQLIFAVAHDTPAAAVFYDASIELLEKRLPAATVKRLINALPVIAIGHRARIEAGLFEIPEQTAPVIN